MVQIEIEDWERESGHFLDIGKKIVNISSQVKYEISSLSIEGLSLKKIPYFRNEKDEPLEIAFEELEKAFRENILLIEGFESNEVKELKIAIASLKKKINLAFKENHINSLDRMYKEKDEELTRIKKEAEERKLKEEAELQKEAEAKRQKEEAERLKKEAEEKKKKEAEEKLNQRKQKASDMEVTLIELELSL
jgi:hypothetical protein